MTYNRNNTQNIYDSNTNNTINTNLDSLIDKIKGFYNSSKESFGNKYDSVKSKSKTLMYGGLVAATLLTGCDKPVEGGLNFNGYIDCDSSRHLIVQDYGDDKLTMELKEFGVKNCDTIPIISTFKIVDGKVEQYVLTGAETGFENSDGKYVVNINSGDVDKKLINTIQSKYDALKKELSKLKGSYLPTNNKKKK